MNQTTLPLLCDPQTHAPLRLDGDALVEDCSGARYAIRDGVPVFLGEVTGSNRKYQGMYDRLSYGYDIAERLYFWVTRKPNHRPEYMRELEVPAAARVLEVSIGTGANLRYLPANAELYGLDLSAGMLRQCRRNLRRWRLQAELFQGEAESLPFRDATFDCVFHVGGINFFNDRARAIAELIRVAKPGTKIIIADETEQTVAGFYKKNPLTRRYYEGEEAKAYAPVELIPAEMTEVACRIVAEGHMYCLSFRKPPSN